MREYATDMARVARGGGVIGLRPRDGWERGEIRNDGGGSVWGRILAKVVSMGIFCCDGP